MAAASTTNGHADTLAIPAGMKPLDAYLISCIRADQKPKSPLTLASDEWRDRIQELDATALADRKALVAIWRQAIEDNHGLHARQGFDNLCAANSPDINPPVRDGGFVSFVSASKAAPPPFSVYSEPTDEGFVSFVSDPPEPRRLVSQLRTVPTLDPCMLPAPLRDWLADVADRMRVPLDFGAVGAMVSLGSVVGRSMAIRPKAKDDWTVPMNLWGAIIGRPGVLKTPSLEESMKPIHRLDALAREAHDGLVQEHKVSAAVAKAKKESAKDRLAKSAKAGKATDDELRELAREAEAAIDSEVPPERRYVLNDPTIERLGEVLRDNPRGVLLFRDELTGWMKGIERNDRAQDGPFYLEGWNGTGHYTYDRIGRGKVYIPSMCLSVLGGIQPGPLMSYMRSAVSGGGESDNGLIQRFQLLVWPDPVEFGIRDEWPNHDARSRAFDLYRRLDNIDAASIGAEVDQYDSGGIPFLRFTPDAQALFYEWLTALEAKVRNPENLPAVESHLAKYRSLMPKLACLFHLCDVVEGEAAGGVSLKAARMAAAWCEYLEAHALRAYDAISGRNMAAAQRLAEQIRAGKTGNQFKVREIARKCWSGLGSQDLVEQAVAVLVEHGWLYMTEAAQADKGGRPTETYHVNPRVAAGVES